MRNACLDERTTSCILFTILIDMKIILASQSSYRKHALDILGLTYETIPSNFDESSIRHDDPKKLAQLLSEAKCKKVAEEHTDGIIVSADLFVVYKNKIFEKPISQDAAIHMLKTFSGNSFDIITGLAVFNCVTGKLLAASESCEVRFRELTDFEIENYTSRYPVTKFAGAFDADGLLRFAERINGNYNFEAALPVDKLVLFLRKNGITV